MHTGITRKNALLKKKLKVKSCFKNIQTIFCAIDLFSVLTAISHILVPVLALDAHRLP